MTDVPLGAAPSRPVPLGPALARRVADPLDRAIRRMPLAGTGPTAFEGGVTGARALRWVDRRTDTRIDTSRSGRALVAAAPDALGRLASRLTQGVVLVSATNGKTTTTALLTAILTTSGRSVVTSPSGINMVPGLTAELIGAARLGGRMAADIGVFEVDELWLGRVLDQVAPRVLVLGNLFTDQVDRTGGVEAVAEHWAQLIEGLDAATTLVVTADDPRVLQAAARHPHVVTFGLEPAPGPDAAHEDAPATGPCAHCGEAVRTSSLHIGHLGRWECVGCGDRRPQPDVEARAVSSGLRSGSRFTLVTSEGSTPASTPLPGRFNVVNAAAAVAAARVLGTSVPTAAAALSTTPGTWGRAEAIAVAGRALTVLLAKNPTGLDEIVELLVPEGPGISLLFLLNDDVNDGRDASWIWDADLERLAPLVAEVTCGGTRAGDAARRWHRAGVDPAAVTVVAEPDAGSALDRALARPDVPVLAVCNYTAMLDLRETLAERGHVARYWMPPAGRGGTGP